MEQWEFEELAIASIGRLLPRIPDRYVRGLERALNAGEFTIAVDDLVVTLVNNNMPVTRSEQEDLRRLLDHLRRPTDPIDSLTLIPQP